MKTNRCKPPKAACANANPRRTTTNLRIVKTESRAVTSNENSIVTDSSVDRLAHRLSRKDVTCAPICLSYQRLIIVVNTTVRFKSMDQLAVWSVQRVISLMINIVSTRNFIYNAVFPVNLHRRTPTDKLFRISLVVVPWFCEISRNRNCYVISENHLFLNHGIFLPSLYVSV